MIVNFSEDLALTVTFSVELDGNHCGVGYNILFFQWAQQLIIISMDLTIMFHFLVELAMIMDRLYGGVCYAGIDTDPELKYPKVIKYKSRGIN
jgi:hypothetical protein